MLNEPPICTDTSPSGLASARRGKVKLAASALDSGRVRCCTRSSRPGAVWTSQTLISNAPDAGAAMAPRAAADDPPPSDASLCVPYCLKARSEERRVGKECRSRRAAEHQEKIVERSR